MGEIYEYFLKKRKEKPLIIPLLDPDKFTPDLTKRVLKKIDNELFDAYLVGGSTAIWQTKVDLVVQEIKKHTNKPVILFPNGISSLSPFADAVLFISLLNSSNTFYIVEQQAQAAPIIKEMGLEPISTAYIIIGDGGTAGFVGHARPIPFDKPELTVAYALAAEYFGFRFIYLEAGSGTREPVPSSIISAVKKVTKSLLIVGGGIRNSGTLIRAVKAGADCVILGNVLENEQEAENFIKEMFELKAFLFQSS
ncbi:hypothetical protein B9Q11_02915 [Candidatus Marsarchaeota G2 archaeon ECH_B_SAG-F08]|jgi:geranylgeranylglyceryl phosphate synthase|uniref:Geranylgeranylglyceryl phosphate synthase n=5 Tax=Candidatus Marsarchaeota TaxID=1978152 RepID=A0A2R6C136_9ARCH|nr:MAG: hypothetical protein B9Q01_00820 [Candidatus Marsarchaeota G1 archaeon OSP_D]PSN89161.1 MAG: hypothetical protein B9Q00_02790 [Candidatus Marsarchaeota G1 archaeon OSP_C]PSN98074.1 MAG: hypothetical protein B9Q11_02915 [Candidatus Marsarchaeota G2 archaeon ECH_B_SAG-F08]PSO04567.1 MAG: hypothetical protein B9Q12_02200 [Candidatus Marsarchaeota G2 archaeon ECH_B_SAG-G06]PSO04815.1 MAG: hypothetical protein B9Q13_03510 [Candidatus Marsarchaeota G2 archaeon ECH_B_SAG-G16]